MPESALTVQTPVVAGVAKTLAAANVAGNSFPNAGYTFLEVLNGSGAPITVTVKNQRLVGPDSAEAFDADVAVTIAAGATKIIGPFTDQQRFSDADGDAHVEYSSVTTVSVASIRVY